MSKFFGGVVLGLLGGIAIAALILQPTGALTQGMLGALVGGLLAISGGWFANLHMLRSARKTNMDEAVAAKKMTANAEAYRNVKEIEAAFAQRSVKDTHNLMMGLEQWFFDNRLFLPGAFPNHWLTACTNLGLLAMRVHESPSDDSQDLERKVHAALAGAIAEIYADSGIPHPSWDRFSDRKVEIQY
jgi:hypothetical protein